jgi:hypothetical protein
VGILNCRGLGGFMGGCPMDLESFLVVTLQIRDLETK